MLTFATGCNDGRGDASPAGTGLGTGTDAGVESAEGESDARVDLPDWPDIEPTPDVVLDAVPDTEPHPPRPGGNECTSDGDCGTYQYCEDRYGDAFCAPAPNAEGVNCTDDSDCVFEGSDELFCCTTTSFSGRECVPASTQGGGVGCGDNRGMQGADCSEHGHSDCRNDSHFCVFEDSDYSFCAQACGPTFGTCEPGSYCFYLVGPWGFCMPEGGTLEPGENCLDDPFSCEEQAMCINRGASDDPHAWCATLCREEGDCPVEETCNAFGLCEPQGSLRAGASCLGDRFACGVGLACVFEGTRAAECSRLCEEDYECPLDSYCFDLPRRDDGVCRERGDLLSGEFCGDDPGACPGLCTGGYLSFDPGGYCLEQCADDDECRDGALCAPVGDLGTYCLPNGDAAQGEGCVLDAFDCAADHFCVDYGSVNAFCAEQCTSDDDCADGTWCTIGVGSDSDFGICYPSGETPAGEECEIGGYTCEEGSYCAIETSPRCFTPCTDPPHDCPAGHQCLDENRAGERWCYPDGTAEYGESCADDPYACANPGFCSDYGSDDARCTRACLLDEDCDGDDWCLRTVYGGFCRPGGGTLTQGESCEDEIYSCERDLLCILGGETGSFCAAECTGFADSCGEGEACRFLGYGLNFCVEHGDVGHGGACVDDRFACDEESWCVNAGTDSAVCVRTCSEDATVCSEGTRCQYLAGGFGVCIGAGLSPSDPLNPGGDPL